MNPATCPTRAARWFRRAPFVLLLAPLLLVVRPLGSGQGKTALESGPKKAAQQAKAAVPVEVRFTDDSVLKLTLSGRAVRVNTRYGKLLVPVADIRYIDFATRISDGDARRTEAAIADLGSKQYKVRQAAGAVLLGLREKAYPALLKAARHKDLEIVRRAEALVKLLRERVPPDHLAFRKNDVIRTVDSRITGRIDGEAIQGTTVQFGAVRLKPDHMRSLQFVGVAPDPGNLEGLRDLVGKTFRFRVTGSVAGPLFGSGTYTSDSSLATAAVHAGVLTAGQTGVVRVTLVFNPGGYAGTAINGVTSTPYGIYPGAYQVGRD
jgi:hypothetical protein